MIKVPAGVFKAKCLKLMDDVSRMHHVIVITKHGKAVAKLVPISSEEDEKSQKPLFGCMKGTIKIVGDIMEPTGEIWEADA